MKPEEIKELIIRSLDSEADNRDISRKLEDEGIFFDFSNNFREVVSRRIFASWKSFKQETEFVRNMNFAFKSIAISGVAAIIVLIISIYLMEGSISLDSFLGLRDNYDESIICLLTGK